MEKTYKMTIFVISAIELTKKIIIIIFFFDSKKREKMISKFLFFYIARFGKPE